MDETRKAMACLRASLSPVARAAYKYSLGISEDDQKKPHMVIIALRGYYGASIGVSGERQKFLRLLQSEKLIILSPPGRHGYAIKLHNVNMRISLMSL